MPLADQSPTPAPTGEPDLLKYGAIGVLAFLLLVGLIWAVRFGVAAYNREKDRADRLEAAIEKNYMDAMVEAIDALKDALNSVRRG